MRTFLLLFGSFLGSAQAQVWCPPGARWIYDTGSPGITSQTQFTYIGDTIVDGSSAQRISQEGFISELFGNDTLIETGGQDIITRSEEGVVFRWIEADLAWDTLYWFSAEPGDEWTPGWAFGEVCEADFRLLVLDTGSMVVQGIWLRSLIVQRLSGPEPVGDPELIAERLGTITGYFEPIAGCNSVFECYCSFQCYSDADLSYPMVGEPCALALGSGSQERSRMIVQISPNPGRDEFNLRSLPALKEIVVRDVAGRPVVNLAPVGSDHVSTITWPPGCYVVEAVFKNGVRVMRTWIKQ